MLVPPESPAGNTPRIEREGYNKSAYIEETEPAKKRGFNRNMPSGHQLGYDCRVLRCRKREEHHRDAERKYRQAIAEPPIRRHGAAPDGMAIPGDSVRQNWNA
jgi:hypothetical protein